MTTAAAGSGERKAITEETRVPLKYVAAFVMICVIPLAVYLTRIQDDVGTIKTTLTQAVGAMKEIESDHEQRIRVIELRKP